MTRSQLFFYSLLALPLAFVELPLFVNLPKFYAEEGMNLAIIGYVLLVVRSLDALKDPILGYAADYFYKGPASRFFMIGLFAPLLALGFYLLWNPPEEGTSLIFWFALTLFCVHFADSAMIIAYYSLGAEMAPDYHERTRVTSFRESFRIVGLLMAAVIPTILVNRWGREEGFSQFSLLFIAVLLGAYLLFLKSKPKTSPTRYVRECIKWQDLKSALQDKDFLWIAGLHMLNVFAFSCPTALFAFVASDIVCEPQQEGFFLMSYFVSGILGMMLWTTISKKWGKKKALLASLYLSVFIFAFAIFLKPHMILPFYGICFLAGLSFGADLALPPSILADVIAEQTHLSKPPSGIYFGVWNITAKFSTALAPGLIFPFLSHMGYEKGITSPDSLFYLLACFTLLPAGLKLATAILLQLSPLEKRNL
ncbi:MFS transporter [Candidatus Bealeia paramacronuclearis]|uniref:MFS transporter n=1 Tax=Candidatus Bealeia paramacronuclearis TaxID=1921001 RepID=A0ABZ2C5N0_9PROT|nr:MFS transporter [Candidatus Bealeia paramacronuclearis]